MPNRSTKVTDQVSLKIVYISIVLKKKNIISKNKKNHYLNEVFFLILCFIWMLLSLYNYRRIIVITTIYYM